jgi:hypothetical protein
MRLRGHLSPCGGEADGSVLLLVLFVCLAIVIVTQTLVAVALCGERARADEMVGRELQAARDGGLASLRERAAQAWEELPWRSLERTGVETEGQLRGLGVGGWLMEADARQNGVEAGKTTSAWVERGRDGVDLPLAALVARGILATSPREEPWVDTEGVAEGPAQVFLGVGADGAGLGDGCVLRELEQPWRLDPGWQALAEPGPGVGLGPQVLELERGCGGAIRLTRELKSSVGREPGWPLLVILAGGADLDARSLGDFYGVVVVDDGSVQLDGTTLHGALFVTKTVDVGTTGKVLFSRPILRWATDRSLIRTRLVPGTRSETIAGGTD